MFNVLNFLKVTKDFSIPKPNKPRDNPKVTDPSRCPDMILMMEGRLPKNADAMETETGICERQRRLTTGGRRLPMGEMERNKCWCMQQNID